MREWKHVQDNSNTVTSGDDYYFSGIYIIHRTSVKNVSRPYRVYRWAGKEWLPIKKSLTETLENAKCKVNRHSEKHACTVRLLANARKDFEYKMREFQ